MAKGTITTMSCDPATSGFEFTENYVLGPGGEELTMFGVPAGGSAGNTTAWQRTNVYAAGKLLATYDMIGSNPALHFHLTDPLGSRRMQLAGNLPGNSLNLAPIGQPETDIQSLPFGDQLNSFPDQYAPATADDSTSLHFTGKERDQESGNDYFGARYYASTMGRFLSPDWSKSPQAVPYADLENPQSLNLYAYVNNNPLSRIDADGHCGDGWHWLCSIGQAIGNAFTGLCFFCTDTQLNNRTEARRQWLQQHTILIHGDGTEQDWQKADRKMIDKYYDQAHDPMQAIPKLPIPPMPPGATGPADFGKTMGWGRGDAEARARMESLTKEELEKNGVTKDMAEAWRDFYKNEMERNPGNPSAAGRADLMQRAVDLLDGKQ